MTDICPTIANNVLNVAKAITVGRMNAHARHSGRESTCGGLGLFMAAKAQIHFRVGDTYPDLPPNALLALETHLKPHLGKDVVLTIARGRKNRSLNQNSYYWGVVIPMVHAMLVEFGNDVGTEETHAFLKEHVGKLTAAVSDGSGKRLAIVKSSATLTTAEFEQHLERIKRWAANFGTVIPDPGQPYQPLGELIA